MERLERFFLKNLAYCTAVKHRNPAESLYCTISSSNKNTISSEINKTLIEKDGKKLIYMFFLDKQTKENLNKVLNEVSFDQFNLYFDTCLSGILNDNLALNYMFQFVNFFHLIGTLRLLKDSYEQREKINDLLLNIINLQSVPFIIQYSASQIYVSQNLKNPIIQENYDLQRFYEKLINKINSDDSFTKFVALYSMYYNSFNMKADIMRALKEMITDGTDVDFNALHTYLPQIHSILVRSHKTLFDNEINAQKSFIDLYSIEKNQSYKVIDMLNMVDRIIS